MRLAISKAGQREVYLANQVNFTANNKSSVPKLPLRELGKITGSYMDESEHSESNFLDNDLFAKEEVESPASNENKTGEEDLLVVNDKAAAEERPCSQTQIAMLKQQLADCLLYTSPSPRD